MDMNLTITVLAIVTVLTHHSLSLTIADRTRGLNNASSSSVGFSLPLVANLEPSLDHHTVHRSSDGFLNFHHRLGGGALAASNVTAAAAIPPLEIGPELHVNIGTGSGQQHVVLKYDTTGSLTWLQCDPCTPKARQLGPLFVPHLSPTYRDIEATSPSCSTLFEPDPATGKCTFRMRKTGINVKGVVARDHVAVATAGGNVIEDYLFGCVYDTQLFKNDRRYAGVFVNSRAPYSFVSQGVARGVTRFSYCISGEFEAANRRHGFLRFGTDVPHNPGYRTTGILPALRAHETAYYVSLVGVSLGTRRLDMIRPEMFRRREDDGGQGGCIVDIGTPLTVMARDAYRIIEEAVWADLRSYDHGAEQVKRVDYSLCVRATTEAIKGHLPSLSLHFAGEGEEEATLVVSPEQLFLIMEDEQPAVRIIACLAMASGPRTVVGALQQVDTRFVFDLKDNKLYFAPESCTRDTA